MFRIAITLLVALPLLAQAQPAKQRPTPEWLLSLARVGEYHVSPDGKRVVYGVTRISVADNKGDKDLYIAGTSAPANPKALLAEPGNQSSPRWTPDGRKIGYLADKDGTTQVWVMNPDGTGREVLTQAPKDVDGFVWLPGNAGLIYSSKVKLDTSLAEKYPDASKTKASLFTGLLYRHWNRWADGTYAHLFWLPPGKRVGADLMEGQPFDCPVPPMGGMEDVAVSADGRFVYYACRKERGAARATSTNTDIYQIDLQARATRNLTEGNPGYDRNPAPSADGKRLAYTSMAGAGNEADKARLLVLDLATGQRKDLTANFDEGLAGTPVWAADGKGLYAPVHQRGTEQIFYFGQEGTAPRMVSQGRQNLADCQLAAGGQLVCTRTAMDAPADLIALDPKRGTQSNLTQANAQTVANTELARIEQRMVRTSDGKDMLVWMILPPGFDPAKKYPALLFCQGGPQSPVSQNFSYRWNFNVLSAPGYVIVAPCRRGMPGFGRSWNDEISGDWGGQPMRDYLAAIDDAATLPYVDRNRLGAVGASYGGYSVYYLAGIHQKRFKAFISHCGVYNLESMFGTTEELFFSNHEMGGPYWQKPQPGSYVQYSPHRLVDRWDTPMLVIHGGLDFRVPEGQGMEAYTAAQMRGIPSKFLYFPDEGHWVLKPQNSLVWHREFFDWLETYLKP